MSNTQADANHKLRHINRQVFSLLRFKHFFGADPNTNWRGESAYIMATGQWNHKGPMKLWKDGEIVRGRKLWGLKNNVDGDHNFGLIVPSHFKLTATFWECDFFPHCGVETPLKAPFLHFQIPVKDWRCLCGINLARWTRMRGYLAAASKEVSRIESNTNFETTFCCKGNGHSNQAVIFFDLWCPWFFFMRWFQEIASKSDRGITPPLSGMQRNMWGIPAGRGPVVTSL